MDLLVFLASQEGRVVSKDEIIEGVWEGRFIAEATLTRSIADLRHALGDDRRQPQYIETIAKRGYRLVAGVSGLDHRAGWPAGHGRGGRGPADSASGALSRRAPAHQSGPESDRVFLRRSYRRDHQYPDAPRGTSGHLPHVCVCGARARRRHRRHRSEPRCHVRYRGQRAAGREPHPGNGAVDPGEQSLPRVERAVQSPPFRRLRDPGRNRGDHRAPSRADAGRPGSAQSARQPRAWRRIHASSRDGITFSGARGRAWTEPDSVWRTQSGWIHGSRWRTTRWRRCTGTGASTA